MALAQLVVALCLLALSLGNEETKSDLPSSTVSKNSTPKNKTDQQKGGGEEKQRFLRWAYDSPTDEFSAIPFSADTEHEKERSPWESYVRRSAAMFAAASPPLDKIGGGFVVRELEEPEVEGLVDSPRGETFGINQRFPLHREFISPYSAVKDIPKVKSLPIDISKLTDPSRLARKFDSINKGVISDFGVRKGFQPNPKKSGSGFYPKRNFDEIDRSGLNSMKKRNFDEIDRAGFHSLGKRNFDEIDRAGFHSLGRRNFDEIDKSGFRDLGKRNFDEIDRSGFRDFGKRNAEESEIQRPFVAKNSVAENNEFEKRNFDEIDRSGFRSFSKRSASGEKFESSP